MELSSFSKMVTQVGFPITVAIISLYAIYLIIKHYTELNEKNLIYIQKRSEEREEKLTHELREGRKINAEAINTIRRYADRLDKIEEDVDNIRTNIETIKAKI